MFTIINSRWPLNTINSRWAFSVISKCCKAEAIALHRRRDNRKARKSQTNADEEIKKAEGKMERARRATSRSGLARVTATRLFQETQAANRTSFCSGGSVSRKL